MIGNLTNCFAICHFLGFCSLPLRICSAEKNLRTFVAVEVCLETSICFIINLKNLQLCQNVPYFGVKRPENSVKQFTRLCKEHQKS